MSDEWPAAELFDEDYLHFYLPRLSEETTAEEASVVWNLLSLNPGSEVLDLACGHGRIANRLAADGALVTGLDATPLFLDMARGDAEARGVDVSYIEGDMRAIPWTDRFDAIVSWFTAYGYFDDEQNRALLTSVHDALRSGRRFLLELNHKDGLLPTWLPSTVVEVDGSILIDRREYDPLTGRSNNWRTIVRGGHVRQTFFFTRLFSYTELCDWLIQAGFRSVQGFAGDGRPLIRTDRRMILVATK